MSIEGIKMIHLLIHILLIKETWKIDWLKGFWDNSHKKKGFSQIHSRLLHEFTIFDPFYFKLENNIDHNILKLCKVLVQLRFTTCKAKASYLHHVIRKINTWNAELLYEYLQVPITNKRKLKMKFSKHG